MSEIKMPAEHELWLKTNGKEGKQLNLSGKDFYKKDLSNSMMIDVIFDGANMDYVDLSYSNLGFCSFKNASLLSSNIVKTEANDTNFEDAKLNNGNFFRSTFIRTSFNKADLTNTNFSLTLLKDADFTNAILDKCQFSEASLSAARGLDTVKLEWIDIGQAGNIKRLYGKDAIRWLLSEAEKSL